MLQLLPNDQPVAIHAPTERARPLGNYVLVELEAQPDKTSGGILKPASMMASEKKDVSVNPMARVLAVGPGLPMDGGRRYDMDVNVGDKVQLLRVLAPAMTGGPTGKSIEGRWFVDVGQILAVIEPVDG